VFDNQVCVLGRYHLGFRYYSSLFLKSILEKSKASKVKITVIPMNSIISSHTHIPITRSKFLSFFARERQRESEDQRQLLVFHSANAKSAVSNKLPLTPPLSPRFLS
jgi:hypothetical protein